MSIPLKALLAAVILLTLTAILTPFLITKTETWPHCFYLQTSDWKFGVPESPWAYRLAKPVLAGLLPGDNRYSFVVLTYIGLIMASLGIFLLAREFKLRPAFAYLGMVLFAFSYPYRKSLMYPWMLDDWNMVFLIFGILFIKRMQWFAFSVCLALGCLNHEHALFLVVIFLFSIPFSVLKDKPVRAVSYLMPAILVFVLIRWIIPIPNKAFFSYYFSVQNIRSCYQIQGGLLNILSLIYNTFGMMWLLALFGLLKLSNDRVLQSIVLFFPVTLLQLIIGCDTSRLVSINFPLILILGLQVLQRLPMIWSVFSGCIFLLRSIARFAGISFFHPEWVMLIPTQVIACVEMAVFIGLMFLYRNDDFRSDS